MSNPVGNEAARSARVAWARRPHTTHVQRSWAYPAQGGPWGHGQCPMDALDAAHECDGCGRLPQEGCRCNVVELAPPSVERTREAA